VFGSPWLVWLDEERDLVVVDVTAGTRRTIDFDAPSDTVLAGVWNGRLLAYSNERAHALHVVDLADGRRHSLLAPGPIDACIPEGALVAGHVYDPCAGTLRALELPVARLDRVFRRAPDDLWISAARGSSPVRFDLTAGPVRRPDGAPPLRPLELPSGTVEPDVTAAARAAWRASRRERIRSH
jgi:hypothetical protein